MKKRPLLILASVLVIGAVALIVALIGSKNATFDQDYHIQDVSSITKVFLTDKENRSVLIERVGHHSNDSAWMVDHKAYADQSMVDMLLETLNTMRIRQQVNKAAVANVIKRIATNSVKVQVYQKVYFINWFNGALTLFPYEKCTTYFVGFETQDQLATHFWREGDKEPVIVHIPGFRGSLGPRFSTLPESWMSHRIVAVDIKHLQSVELEIPDNQQESFVIRRQDNGFAMELLASHTLVNSFDTARVAQFLSSFANLNFDEFVSIVPNADRQHSFAAAPRAIVRISDVYGHKREVKTYLKYSNPDDRRVMADTNMYNLFDVDRLYAVIDNKDTVLIQYYSFDNILQPASFFLAPQRQPVRL